MEPRRNEFRERMNQFKKAREANPLLSYWEWKAIPKYDEGTDGIMSEEERIEQDRLWVIDWFDKRRQYDNSSVLRQLNEIYDNHTVYNYKHNKSPNTSGYMRARSVDTAPVIIKNRIDNDPRVNAYYHPIEGVVVKRKALSDKKQEPVIHEFSHIINSNPLNEYMPQVINGIIQNLKIYDYGNEMNQYLTSPNEIHSRLMEFRKLNNLDPTKDVGMPELKYLKKHGKDRDLFKLFEDDNVVLDLLNNTASIQKEDNIRKVSDGSDGIKMTPEQEKKFLEDRQKYAAMSGVISPALDIRTAADFTPIGNAIASKEIYDATSSGNYLDAGLIGASLVVPPVLAKPVKRYIPTVSRTVADKINKLLDNSNTVKETEWNNTVNRAIERIYDKDVRDRAALLKDKYGVDILSQYDAIDDLYTNNYESIPKARIMHMDDGARAKMHTNPTASKTWATEGKPAGMKDFEMQVRPDVEPSKEVAEHEVNHWWTYSMMQNPDWRRSELLKITKDFEKDLLDVNPLAPTLSKYFRDWMELNAYGINVVNEMKEKGIPFTKENVIKFINSKSSLNSLKRAAYQFKNMDAYFRWLLTMPLAATAGAVYMLGNEE